MRAGGLAFVLFVVGCQGDPVVPATTDATADASADTSTAADTDACPAIPGNIVTDGDFTTGAGGWKPADCKSELIDGKCGKGLRLTEVLPSGRVGRAYYVVLPNDAKLRLRAWFKKVAGKAAGQGRVFIRSYWKDDAGAEHYDDYDAVGPAGDDWAVAESVVTLRHEQPEAFEIFLGPRVGDSIEVSNVSVVKE